MRPRWCDLPSDLLHEIDSELAYIDKVRVCATCLWWNSALHQMPNHRLPQLPWLLHTNVDKEGTKSQALFNLCENKSYRVDLPQLQGKLLKGSSHGWLVTISVDQNYTTPSSPDICLLNPLTGVQLQLPPRSTFPDVVHYFPDRVGQEYRLVEVSDEGETDFSSNHVHQHLTYQIATSSSSLENCVAVAVYGEFYELAWCLPGLDKWSPFCLDQSAAHNIPVEDVMFLDDKLYVVNCYRQLFQVENIGTLNPKITQITQRSVPTRDHLVLVECSDGKLMMVIVKVHGLVEKFETYEVDIPNKCWHLVNNISNDMLFLGHNLSFSIPSCQFPGYRGNSVYFSDDPQYFGDCEGTEGYANIGIFNFEDESAERLPGFKNVPRSLWSQAVWVTPPS